MPSSNLRNARKKAGLTQQQVANALGVSQAYWALIENGKRRLTEQLATEVLGLLDLRPTALPLGEPFHATPVNSQVLARALSGLGYPQFAYLQPAKKWNPAALLLSALASDDLEMRVVEALPWVVLQYSDMDWEWLVRGAKLHDLQNRLGFVVSLSQALASSRSDWGAAAPLLAKVAAQLERARLMREDTLCQRSLSAAEREWLGRSRPSAAEYWNLLTDLCPEGLPYGA